MKLNHSILSCCLLISANTAIKAQNSITSSSFTYTEDFDNLSNSGLSTTMPHQWVFLEEGTSADNQYTDNAGNSTAGNSYSYGSSMATDRAFGAMNTSSSMLKVTLGTSFQNNAGLILNSLTISYYGECWRIGEITNVDKIKFEYSTNATSLTTGTWNDVQELEFKAPDFTSTGIKDGNLSVNRTQKIKTLTGLNLTNGSTIWFRWVMDDATGSDDGLAVDDFSLSNIVLPIYDLQVSAKALHNQVVLWWKSENANPVQGFKISKYENEVFQEMNFVKSDAIKNEFTYIDDAPLVGDNYYKLETIDELGVTVMSKISYVNVTNTFTATLSIESITAEQRMCSIVYHTNTKEQVQLNVINALGQIVAVKTLSPDVGVNYANIEVRDLSQIYCIRLYTASLLATSKVFIK